MPRRPAAIPQDDERAIGARLKDLRQRQNFNQLALAKAIGIHQSLLSRYERGELRLHGALLAKIARTLKVSSDQILGVESIKDGGQKPHPQIARRIAQIEKLSRRNKQALLKNLDLFLKGAGVA